MPMNDVATTQQVLKVKADQVTDVAHVSAAPTMADYNTLADAFNNLLAQLREVNINIKL